MDMFKRRTSELSPFTEDKSDCLLVKPHILKCVIICPLIAPIDQCIDLDQKSGVVCSGDRILKGMTQPLKMSLVQCISWLAINREGQG